jgi:hypothetical protein
MSMTTNLVGEFAHQKSAPPAGGLLHRPAAGLQPYGTGGLLRSALWPQFKYGRATDILMDNGVGSNGPVSQSAFAALGQKWVSYFARLTADADAPLPALGEA